MAECNIKQKNMLQLAEYQRSLWRHPNLRFLFFELTDRCNLNCLHCGSGCTAQNSTCLACDAIERVLGRVAERYRAENIMVCLTGGEPMLHPDLFRVIRQAVRLGFPVGMTTNGTLIDSAAASRLAESGLDTVAVSIDGPEDAHDAFRRAGGSFALAVRGVHALQAAGLEPQVITVVHRQNFSRLEELFRFLSAEGVRSWRLVNIDPIGRARENAGLLLSGRELRGLYDFVRDKRFDPAVGMEVTCGCSHFLTYEYEHMVRNFYFQCQAGTQAASVMANGDIGACLDIERRPELIQGNVYRDDFVGVWENGFGVYRRNRADSSETCRRCGWREVCMGDSAHTWDYEKQEPAYCVVKLWEEEDR